ncbi:MAG: low-specificity L-threonine aldolase [Myxococcota bacterium]
MIDLRSDTVTKPTPAMRAAMAAAEVGDDVFGEDPTVNALERRVAAMFGKEAGLFVPSGTQANQIAIRCLTEPGDEVILEATAHPYLYEAGGAGVISGVTLKPIPGERGVLDPDVVRAAVRPPNVHHAPARLLSVENTANRGGGTVVSLERVRALCDVARAAGLRTHLDGARVWNAHVASGVSLADYAAPFDVVNVCFSKGLGAPVGSMVLLPAAMLEKARRVRKMLGGGMRQAGVLAAACHHALDHHLARLADDHARARRLWEGLSPFVRADRPETNMVYVTVPDAPAVAARLAARVRCIALSHDQIRLVTHLEIDDAAVEGAIGAFRDVLGR